MTFLSGFRYQPRFTVARGIYLIVIASTLVFTQGDLLAQDKPTNETPAQIVTGEVDPAPQVSTEPEKAEKVVEAIQAAVADDAAVADNAAAAPVLNYMPAVDLFPKNTAGYVRIPNAPDFCKAGKQMHIGKLIDDPVMKPFIDAQKARAESYFDSLTDKIKLRPTDLYDIVSGEVAMAWLPAKDKRRPFSVCVIADVRGLRDKADLALEKIDKDLKAGGATRTDVKHQGEEIRVYKTKPKPGQLKVEQIAISLNDARIIAADRDTVVQDLLDAVAGMPKGEPLSRLDDFKIVMSKSETALAKTVKDGGTKGLEWFAEPFQMARILRKVFEIERGSLVDIVKLLESQGFTAVKAVGGVASLNGKRFDLLHRGFLLAPGPFAKAAKMLGFFNRPLDAIPDWVGKDTSAFTRFNWRIDQAFWASEGLINEAMGDDIFRPIIEGIRDDEEGPQIDLAKDFFPNLDDQIILISDNTLPPAIDSERVLVAIRLKNAAAVKNVVRKAMLVEPDATELKALPGVEIWQVQRGEGEEDLGEALEDLGFEDPDEEEDAGQKPLLDHWAIGVVQPDAGVGGPGFAYLVFSSHPELLIETAKRIKTAAKGGIATLGEVKTVVTAMKDLGAKDVSYDHVARMKLGMRVKYELLRKGQLKDSDSILATLIRRISDDEQGGQPDPLNASKLPPLNQIEKYMPDGGAYFESTDKGWLMTGFYLK